MLWIEQMLEPGDEAGAVRDQFCKPDWFVCMSLSVSRAGWGDAGETFWNVHESNTCM